MKIVKVEEKKCCFQLNPNSNSFRLDISFSDIYLITYFVWYDSRLLHDRHYVNYLLTSCTHMHTHTEIRVGREIR